ncbi:hypothetical protein [Pseudobacillus badius]|uniref:hypothetical protein n=1 Tax=Bacillus badius TaxID=1455 RepID=UPI0024A3DD6D|nr:hypothetical protein [Bacillus badius]GLY11339.1 hypothetical protein Bbad01_25550 [Bacillus badius]
MKSFIVYQAGSFFYSLKWMPPVILYITWLFSQYYYQHLPVADSHAISAFALFPVMVWIAMIVCSLERGSEKLILLSYMRRREHFLYGKLLVIFLAGLALSAVSFTLPLLLGIFSEPLSIGQAARFLYGHTALSLLGLFIGVLFSATSLGGKKYSWSGSAFVVCAAVAAPRIAEALPAALQWIVLTLPPVAAVTDAIKEGIFAYPAGSTWTVIYITASFLILRYLFLKREKIN